MIKFLISRITNPWIKRHSWKQRYSSFPSVKLISNRLNKLPAYKSAGKRQRGRKKSTPILILPIDTCCSLLSIFDHGTICPLSGCDKTKLQTFPQRKTKWKSRFSAKVLLIRGEMWAICENRWVLYLLILSAIETILSFTKQDLPIGKMLTIKYWFVPNNNVFDICSLSALLRSPRDRVQKSDILFLF